MGKDKMMTIDDTKSCLAELEQLEDMWDKRKIREPYLRARLMGLVSNYNPNREEYYYLKNICRNEVTKNLLAEID